MTVDQRENVTVSTDPEHIGGRKARTDVARAMILAAVVSLLVVGGFNLYLARQFLTGEAEDLLIDIGAARGIAVERGLERLRFQISL